MNETQQVSQLIGDIYDAALDRSLWPRVLEQTCEYVKGCASSLMSHDSADRSGQFYFSWGDDPYYTKLYFEKYVKISPLLVPLAAAAHVGQVAAAFDFVPQDEYFASRFYKEWAKPQGYGDNVYAVLDKSTTSSAAVIVARYKRHGLTDENTRRRMGLLAPHFRRGVNIGKIIEFHKVEAAALADTLDGLAAAMFLVDADARIIHANAQGQVMLDGRDVLRSTAGRLAAGDAVAQQALKEVFAAAAGGDAGIGVKGIAIPLPATSGERWLAHILPLTSGARRRAGVSYAAVAAVFVRKAAPDLPSPIETLAQSFALTPAELRVLLAIVQVGGVPDVADVLGISQTTVRTHLASLFEKTGTDRQADLVRIVAGFGSPLRG